VKILPAFIDAISDIHAGSEILLLTWLHAADRRVLKTRPRNNPDTPLAGVFSTRSPDRPTCWYSPGKGIVCVFRWISVSGLEVLDQTPVIDIKPVWISQL